MEAMNNQPNPEFEKFIQSIDLMELGQVIKDLRVYPEDKQHLQLALLELKRREKKLLDRDWS